ncbi:UbiE/COQ5 methyltransferase [hydrothermal vent metagenome]|uniref:UbiE/COQ5 methyltransferase n=1 Tax=hydrothermal vent metagenome TaxID=652676 RepID=A0A3B0UQV1_9ZZZZ
MNVASDNAKQDIWKAWLLERRFAGSEARLQEALQDFLYPVRDKVLDNANLKENETLLDVGCGDGLVGFGALTRFDAGRVVFSDISQELLDHSAELAQQMDAAARCDFVQASADELAGIADGSVDVVTTRSVLIYVADKGKAFQEFYRVLKENGRLSIFEPINNFDYPPPRHIFMGRDVTPIMEITDKIKSVYLALQPPETDPMLNFDERNLFALAETAGFSKVHLELKLELKPSPKSWTWENAMNTAGNPKIPALAEAIDQALTDTEKEQFVSYLRPRFEASKGISRSAVAYLWATKTV